MWRRPARHIPTRNAAFSKVFQKDHAFFAVTRLKDHSGTVEQVFVAVSGIRHGRIAGRIASEVLGVQGYKYGDPTDFPENELIDWLITRPDGSEEGNFVGKFLEGRQKTRQRN